MTKKKKKEKVTLFFSLFFFFDRCSSRERFQKRDSRGKGLATNFRWILTTVPEFIGSWPCCSSSRYATDPLEEDCIIRDDRIYSSCRWYIWTISTQGEKVSRLIEMFNFLNAANAVSNVPMRLNCWTDCKLLSR